MNNNSNLIVGLGEILWDMFPKGRILGGAPTNFAYHVTQLGFNGCAISAVGNDELGIEIINNLKSKHLEYCIEKTTFPTGTVQVTLNEKGIPEYEICENVAWDNIPFTTKTKTLAEQTCTVCFGSLAQRHPVSRTTIDAFIKAMPKDSLKVFDINLRQHFYNKELINHSLKLANILKINEDEVVLVCKLFGMENISEEKMCRYFMDTYKLQLVILTRGTAGSYVFTPTDSHFQETKKVSVADTVGAGDSFTAAFVASYLKGNPIEVAHEFAVDVSAFVCTQHGAMPKFPKSLLEIFHKTSN